MVVVSAEVLELYPRFSLYNSPYVAHDEGCAIDLYPQSEAHRGVSASEASGVFENRRFSRCGESSIRNSPSEFVSDGADERATAAPSPVAGEVIDTRTVSAPPKPYAVKDDHLIVVDTGDHLARILHVKPAVEPGESVAVGDSLGEMIRSGFFAPWVDNHIHLGFRDRDANPFRASGSLPVEVAVNPLPVEWDATGTVVERGETYVVLDSPDHPAPGERFAGLACDGGGILDGGLPHYDGGGLLRGNRDAGPVSLAGHRVGVAEGRTVTWDEIVVRANGTPITGISLCCSRREGFGAKLVCPDATFEVGEEIEVEIG